MSAVVKCERCNDTGSLPGSIYYDCPRCDAATERQALEAWSSRATGNVCDDDLWAIYQRGKDAGAAQDGWVRVAERLPADTGTRYRILALCAKEITDDPTSPYCGQGIVRVKQDWHIRNWPQNFTHWMPLPAAPKP